MIARVVCLIEVEAGGVRRYFTPGGESVGIVAPAEPDSAPPRDEYAGSIEAALDRYGLGRKSLAPAPRRNPPPPFDPTGPGLRMGADDVEDGTDGRADR